MNTGRTRFKKGLIPWNKGKPHPHPESWYTAMKGRIPWNKGKKGLQKAWNKGIKGVSEETRIKMHNSALGKHTGDKTHLWRGGINAIPGRRNWIKQKNNRVKRILNAQGSFHTFGEWETLKAQYNWTCPACHKQEPIIKLTEDHIVPVSKGGGDNIQNIQPLCKSCNCRKMTKIIKY